jgi:hypothetical protein
MRRVQSREFLLEGADGWVEAMFQVRRVRLVEKDGLMRGVRLMVSSSASSQFD